MTETGAQYFGPVWPMLHTFLISVIGIVRGGLETQRRPHDRGPGVDWKDFARCHDNLVVI